MNPLLAVAIIIVSLFILPFIIQKMLTIIFAIIIVIKYGIHPVESEMEKAVEPLDKIDKVLKPFYWWKIFQKRG